MPMRPMFLNILENCIYSGYEPKPSKLERGLVKQFQVEVINLHIMIVDLQNMRYLRECLSQVRLIEMTCIIMKIRVSNVRFMLGGPLGVLPVFLPTHCKPLLEQRYFFPYSIGIDLISKP